MTGGRASLRQLGRPGAVAAALTLVALAGTAWVHHTQGELDGERAALLQRRHQLQRPSTAPAGPAAFVASLPPDSARQARTAALLALTTELGLPWPRSEFRYQTDRELGLAQYRVAMTVAGRYDPLRRFIAEALQRDPALALEALRLRRDGNGEIQAEIAWVLHMQAAR